MPKVPESYLDARRNEIVDAALACFLRKGFHQTTMQDICSEAKLSPGAVYRYFKSKEAIISAVMNRNTEHYAGLIASAKELTVKPQEALELVGRYFFNRLNDPDFEQQTRLEMETWPEALRDPKLREAQRNQQRTMRGLIADLVRPRMEAYPGIEPEALVDMYMAVYAGLQVNKALDPSVDTEGVLAVLERFRELAEAAVDGSDAPVAEPAAPAKAAGKKA